MMNTYYNPNMSGANLARFIKLSGLTKGQVADQKGIAPESLSRHIAGRSHFSIQDAIEYAKILNVTPERLLFEPKPIKIAGQTDLLNVEMYDNSQPERHIRFHHSMRETIQALEIDNTKASYHFHKMIWFFDAVYMKEVSISQACYGAPCVIKTCKDKKTNQKSRVLVRRIFPIATAVPHSQVTFTLQGMPMFNTMDVEQNICLAWACPIINNMMRPDLVGVDIDQK